MSQENGEELLGAVGGISDGNRLEKLKPDDYDVRPWAKHCSHTLLVDRLFKIGVCYLNSVVRPHGIG